MSAFDAKRRVVGEDEPPLVKPDEPLPEPPPGTGSLPGSPISERLPPSPEQETASERITAAPKNLKLFITLLF